MCLDLLQVCKWALSGLSYLALVAACLIVYLCDLLFYRWLCGLDSFCFFVSLVSWKIGGLAVWFVDDSVDWLIGLLLGWCLNQ